MLRASSPCLIMSESGDAKPSKNACLSFAIIPNLFVKKSLSFMLHQGDLNQTLLMMKLSIMLLTNIDAHTLKPFTSTNRISGMLRSRYSNAKCAKAFNFAATPTPKQSPTSKSHHIALDDKKSPPAKISACQ